MRLLLCFLAGLALTAAACTDDGPPTWYQDVAPLLAKRCMSCHQPGGIAPFSMIEYGTVVDYSSRMVAEIDKGTMPPFDAREEADCTPRFSWVDDPRMSAAERATLEAWIANGYLLGEVEQIPPPRSSELTGVTHTLTPDEGWATSGDRDQIICYLLDPEVADGKTRWLTGLQVNPDIAAVVHHVAITEAFPGPALDQLVAQHGIGRPFDCAIGSQPGDFVVHFWAPGNQPMQTNGDIAVPILGGAKLVMQVHYHPAGQTHAPDRTGLDLRITDRLPRRMYSIAAFGNEFQAPNLLPGPGDLDTPRFLIPKGSPDHTEHMRITIPDLGRNTDLRVFSMNPHMHLVGTHISTRIERPAARGGDPQTECLANGGWNFDWQRTYRYDAPLDKLPSLAAGDVIDIKCRWNNTLQNPFVQRMLVDSGLPAQPIDITLGEQTTNEMCLQIFGLSFPVEPQRALPDLDPLRTAADLLKRR